MQGLSLGGWLDAVGLNLAPSLPSLTTLSLGFPSSQMGIIQLLTSQSWWKDIDELAVKQECVLFLVHRKHSVNPSLKVLGMRARKGWWGLSHTCPPAHYCLGATNCSESSMSL